MFSENVCTLGQVYTHYYNLHDQLLGTLGCGVVTASKGIIETAQELLIDEPYLYRSSLFSLPDPRALLQFISSFSHTY